MSIEIAFTTPGPASVLSNLNPHRFVYDGVQCGSMEGFLQALKYPDERQQHEVCRLSGWQAKRYGGAKRQSWTRSGFLWWNSCKFERDGPGYQLLLREAYWSLCAQVAEFRTALMATGQEELTHSMGPDDVYKTVLTGREFCRILTEIRHELLRAAK